MKILDWLFHKNRIECPRCLGKGHVDQQDIERLERNLYWLPGKCAYCKGRGRVPPDMPETVKPDLAYLSLDLPSWERRRLIKGDQAAFNRACEYELAMKQVLEHIRQLYHDGMKFPDDIARHMYNEYLKISYTAPEFQEMVQFIERVIKSI